MRFLITLLSTLAAAASFVAASSPTATRSGELCARIDAPLTIFEGIKPVVIGQLDLCLCLSQLEQFIQVNEHAKVAKQIVGDAEVLIIVALLIEEGQRVAACPSGDLSRRRKRDSAYVEKRALCPFGLDACGVYGGSARAYECVDTRSDLESCGGCSINMNPLEDPSGVDCTSIHAVSDVSCIGGQCVVQRCMNGFEPSGDNSTCLKKNQVEYKEKPISGIEGGISFGMEQFPW